jgi:hypothetical protein
LRGWIGTSLWLLLAEVFPIAIQAAELAPVDPLLEVRLLSATAPNTLADNVTSGALDSYFEPLHDNRTSGPGIFWLKVAAPSASTSAATGLPVLVMHAAHQTRVDVFAAGAPVPLAAMLAAYRGLQDRVFVLPSGLQGGQPVYVRIETSGIESRGVRLSAATLGATLERGAVHARMIALAVGGLLSMAVAALLIWFVHGRQAVFILYATLFFLQGAVYRVFCRVRASTGRWLAYAQPVDLVRLERAGQSERRGGDACSPARSRILRHFSPRIYSNLRLACPGFRVRSPSLTSPSCHRFRSIWVSAIGNHACFLPRFRCSPWWWPS